MKVVLAEKTVGNGLFVVICTYYEEFKAKY